MSHSPACLESKPVGVIEGSEFSPRPNEPFISRVHGPKQLDGSTNVKAQGCFFR